VKLIRSLEGRSLLIVYAVLILLAWALDFWWRGDGLMAWKGDSQVNPFWWGVAALFVGIYWALVTTASRWSIWFTDLEKVFRQILTPLSYLQILFLALLSGFVEEWFFRGVLQPQFGIIVSSFVFGLCHLLPAPRIWIWSFFAFLAGIILGILYDQTQSLVFVASLHALINAGVLWWLNATALRPVRRGF
jgi:membrane protease YdiL (CAAX protease family)